MFKRMLLPLDLQLFSADGTTGGGNWGLTDEQLDGFSLELDETNQTGSTYEEGTQTDSTGQTTEGVGENTQPSYFDIDGEQIDLDTIKQWKSGHMMQSDYTRKTQELADQRRQFEEQFAPYKQLDELFSSNPQLEQQFAQMLNQHFGGQQNQQNPNMNPQVPDISSHPMVRQMQQQLQEQNQFFQQWQEQQRMQQVQAEWETLTNSFPDAKNQEKEIYQFAIDNQTSLENAYKLMNWSNLQKQTEQKMVENNMKKQVGRTLSPQANATNKNAKPSKPDGMDVYEWLKTQDLNLTD